MKKLLVGDCRDENIFKLVDPATFLETEFEAEVIKALTCLESSYWCGVFAGTFALQGERRSSDLALIHKSLSHWFVVEVELAGHSLEHHILPQVRCFRYGEPEQSCVTSLTRAFRAINRDQAATLLSYVPRYVAVVGNRPNAEWSAALRAVDVQHLTVSIYRDRSGGLAHEVEGRLVANLENLGFARYSEIDKCMRIPKGCGLPEGQVQIIDQFGNAGTWTIREQSGVLWISKDQGPTLLRHDCYVQLTRTWDGRIAIRQSTP